VHNGLEFDPGQMTDGVSAVMSALGQKQTSEGLGNVRFTPKSRHWKLVSKCPLCAKSGLMQCSKSRDSEGGIDKRVGDRPEVARWLAEKTKDQGQ
jgi:hypothetical protein